SQGLTPADMAAVKPEHTALAYDNPEPIFQALFPHAGLVRKDDLETTAEFQARVHALGYSGGTYTFMIPANLCKTIAMPDQGFYIIAAKESYYSSYTSDKPFGITVMERIDHPKSFTGQNAFGATTEVTNYNVTDYRVAPIGFFSLPMSLRWKEADDSSFIYFGLPVHTVDPLFRQKLKADKIGLAVRVRIGDPTAAVIDNQGHSATISDPVNFYKAGLLLPVVLLDAWVVDTETDYSVVHWTH
ncbi:MAG: hypothetical protein WCR49_02290, partial [Opitutae bacterium]